MNAVKHFLTAFLFSIMMTTPLTAQQLTDSERIVFLGDSITQAGAQPGGYVSLVRESIGEMLPDSSIEVIGAGISGNKVPDLQARLDRDVLSKEPTIVVIYIGINDVWHSQNGRGTPAADFESGLNEIIDRITATGARVVLCTASVIGEKTDGSNNLDEMLEEYCAISRRVAEARGSGMIDLRAAFIDHLKQENPENQGANILTTDGVHLNSAGNRFVADQMLKGLGVMEEPSGGSGVLRHVVLFQFKDDVSDDDIEVIVSEFGKLKDRIDTIKGYEHGTDISPENLSQGFTHCFMVTFEDEAGRDEYLPHPAHMEFVQLLDGKIENVCVVDFWSGE
ncbi:MAG: GDSL-type esterase/lipase family protein [Planctomycetota bacterium]